MSDGTTARAFWITGPGEGAIREEPLRPPGENEVLVETLYSAISRGTESLVFSGKVPPSQWQAMRAPFQAGDFPAPVKYGYITVGRVITGPDGLKGRTVFCLYPHQDRYVVPADRVTVLPDGVPPARAVLAANMETAVNTLWDAAPVIGEKLAVIGAGTVGCLIAYLARRIPGITLELIDIDSRKATVAHALNLPFSDPPNAQQDLDLVVHASASEAGLETAMTLAGDEGRIIEASWFGTARPAVPLGENFHAKRLTLRASQVGRIPPGQTPRWDYHRRLSVALDLLQDPVLETLITGESAFEDLPETMARLTAAPEGALCHRILYGHSEPRPTP